MSSILDRVRRWLVGATARATGSPGARRGLSLRAQLRLLSLVVMVPFVALIVIGLVQRAGNEREAALEAMAVIARAAVADADAYVRESRELLERLAARPGMSAPAPGRCDPAFSQYTLLAPEGTALLLLDRERRIVCATDPAIEIGGSLAGRPAVERAMREKRFVVGPPVIGPYVGQWVVVFAQPVLDERGEPGALLIHRSKLDSLLPVAEYGTRREVVVRIIDGEGVVLGSSVDPRRWVGTNIGTSEVVRAMTARSRGRAELVGPDGVRRLYAFAPVPGTDWRVYAGLDVSRIHAGILRSALIDAATVALILAAILLLARLVARRIEQPVLAIAKAAQRFAEGTRDARAPVGGAHEIAGFAAEFNRMLDTLQQAERQLRESESRYRRILETTLEGVWAVDAEGRITFANPRIAQMLGYRREEMIGRPFFEFMDEAAQALARRNIARRRGGIAEQYEFRLKRKDGSELWVLVNSSPLTDESGAFAGAFAMISDVTARHEAEDALREANARLHALSMRLLELQERERAEIARELHDEIGQSLTALKLSLQSLIRRVDAKSMPGLERSMAIVEQVLQQSRDLSLDLRPPQLDHLGLEATLRDYLGRVSAESGIETHLVAELRGARIDRSLTTAAFRVAQEALTNALRHARAKRVVVELRGDDEALHLAVSDDGVGFDLAAARVRAQTGESMGLLGMEERVNLAGGRLQVITRPGQGTRVQATFPALVPVVAA